MFFVRNTGIPGSEGFFVKSLSELDQVAAADSKSINLSIRWVDLPNTIDNVAGVISCIQSMIRYGQPIVAIKLVRSITGWGLKDSKDFIDALRFAE